MSAIKLSKFMRRPFEIDAVQVTTENYKEVMEWCHGTLECVDEQEGNAPFIRVKVVRPANERQTQAFAGDWVLKYGKNFKVYTPEAFEANFMPIVEKNEVLSILDNNHGHDVPPSWVHLADAFDATLQDRLRRDTTHKKLLERVKIAMAAGVVVHTNPKSSDTDRTAKVLVGDLLSEIADEIGYRGV